MLAAPPSPFPLPPAGKGSPASIRRSSVQIGRDLDQVAIGIAAIHRPDRAERALAPARAEFDLHAACVQVLDHLLRADGGDEAEVGVAGLGAGAGRPLALVVVMRAQVDLLAA